MTEQPDPAKVLEEARANFYVHQHEQALLKAKTLTSLHRPSLRKSVKKKIEQIVSFLKAILSPLYTKRLTNAQYTERLAQCLQCSQLEQGQPLGFCKACGCGRNRLAELTIKAHLPGSTCPQGKWDNGKPQTQ
jgi:hypothetical protein